MGFFCFSLPRKYAITYNYVKFVRAKCSIKNISVLEIKVVVLSNHVTVTFYETHLINVPLDLFSPACKEEEYRSLDRRENIQKKKKISACSVAQDYTSIYCVLNSQQSASRCTMKKFLLGVFNQDISIFGLVHIVSELWVCSLGWAGM